MTLSWSLPPASDATSEHPVLGYRLFGRLASDGAAEFDIVRTVKSDTTTMTLADLQRGGAYQFKVRAHSPLSRCCSLLQSCALLLQLSGQVVCCVCRSGSSCFFYDLVCRTGHSCGVLVVSSPSTVAIPPRLSRASLCHFFA